MTAQLALDLERAPAHRPRQDLDLVRAELVAAQERALRKVLRATQAAALCSCPRPLLESPSHCVRCGKDVAP